MRSGPVFAVKFKRRRLGLTNYKKRLALIKSGLPRLVVRVSNKRIISQIIVFHEKGDEVLLSCYSDELLKKGWSGSVKNLPAAYLTGLLLGLKVKKRLKFDRFILDAGLSKPNSRVFAVLKGFVYAGLNVNHDPRVLPSDDRVNGSHISEETVNNFNKVKENLLRGE